MAEHEYETEHRVRYRAGDEPDSYHYVATPRAAGESSRQHRDAIERSGRGGEVEIEARAVGKWSGVGEKAVIKPRES
jgi:hypothetical protein